MTDRIEKILQIYEISDVMLLRYGIYLNNISEEDEAYIYKTLCQDDLEKMQSLDLEDFEHMAGLILKYQ